MSTRFSRYRRPSRLSGGLGLGEIRERAVAPAEAAARAGGALAVDVKSLSPKRQGDPVSGDLPT